MRDGERPEEMLACAVVADPADRAAPEQFAARPPGLEVARREGGTAGQKRNRTPSE
jgi:hypothetical protein